MLAALDKAMSRSDAAADIAFNEAVKAIVGGSYTRDGNGSQREAERQRLGAKWQAQPALTDSGPTIYDHALAFLRAIEDLIAARTEDIRASSAKARPIDGGAPPGREA